jgi:hypothetical protein
VTEETAAYRTEATPLVTPNGSRLLARHPGRELFPASWLRHRVRIAYDDGSPGGGDLTGVLLEWRGAGLILRRTAPIGCFPGSGS